MQTIPTTTIQNALYLKLWRIAALVLTIAAVIFISVIPQISNDFWLQVKVGELIAESHWIPKTILFPFTEAKDAPFNAHEWLPSLFFYHLINTVGENSLPPVMGGAGLILFGVMTCLAYQRSENNFPLAVFLGFLAVCVENQRHFLRPELLTLIMLGLYWYLLESCRQRSHYLRWFSAWFIVVLWTNTHGSFILAPIISTIYTIGIWIDQRLPTINDPATPRGRPMPFLWFTLAALLATLLNPVGIELWRFVIDFGHSSSTKYMVYEWLPTFHPHWRSNRGFWIGIGCASITTILMAIRWRRLRAVDVLLFLMFMALAMQAIRFLVYVGIVAAYILPRLVPTEWNATKYRTRWYALVTCISAVVMGLSMKYGNALNAFPHDAFEVSYSLSAPMIGQLKNPELKGNVITSYELGAELVYRAYPRLRPSIDSRIDSYGAAWTTLNAQLFFDDKLLKDFVQHYDVHYMLLSHDDFISLQKLPSWINKDWFIRALDRRTVLLQRKEND